MSQVNTIYCSSIDYMLRVIIACLQIYANLLERWKRCDWCINYCGRCDTGMPPLLHRIMIDMIDVPTCPNQLAEKWLPIWRFRHARGCEPKPWFNSWDEATLLNKSDMEQHFTHSVYFCIQSIAENLILKQLREASRSNTQHPLSSNLQSYQVCWIKYMPIQASLRLNSHARSRNTRGNCTRTAKSLAFCWWATSPREVGISPACPSPIVKNLWWRTKTPHCFTIVHQFSSYVH